MKKLVLLVVAATALAVPATQAQAAGQAGPTLAQFKALQKQVKTLQSQVKTLQKQAKDLNAFANGVIPLLACQDVVTTDALQGTWQSVDTLAVSLGKPAVFGTQTPIPDKGACGAFNFTRSTAIPPTVSVFSSIVTLLTS
jgi:endonuclease/exonuclease/phosphatase (EEP) superfamily protein YafD